MAAVHSHSKSAATAMCVAPHDLLDGALRPSVVIERGGLRSGRAARFASGIARGKDEGMSDDVVAKQISELEAKRYQAMTDGDVGTLGEMFAADLLYTHSDATTD